MPPDGINAFKVEKAALDLLDRYSIDRPGFDVEDLAAAEGIIVRRCPLPSADAWLVRPPGGGGIIRVRDDMKEVGRFRFSVGHEMGHWVLHPDLSQTIICTASDLTDYAKSRPEAEANLFSANLLMPGPWVREDIHRIDPSFAAVERITKEFLTTLTAASWRFTELSRHAVVLIFSTDGRIRWSTKSKAAQPLFVQWGEEIPPNSITRETIAQGINPAGSENTDPNVWFPSWRCDRESELFEDVRLSPTYGWALTLLWMPELG
jgi:hypothetical protein